MLRIEFTQNPWEVMFDSTIFAVFRYGLSALNIFTAYLAFRALLTDIIHVYKSKRRMSATGGKALSWMMMGLFLEFASCVVRAIYYLGGPAYGWSFWSLRDHAYMVNITSPVTFATILLVMIVFKLWMTLNSKSTSFRIKLFFWLVFALLLILELLAGHARYKLQNGVIYSVLSGVIYLAIAVISSLLFVVRGTKFYRSLSSMLETESKKIALRKAVRWLIIGGFVQIGLIIATILLVTSIGFTPWGFFALVVVLGSSESILSLTHTLTFSPRAKSNTRPRANTSNDPKSAPSGILRRVKQLSHRFSKKPESSDGADRTTTSTSLDLRFSSNSSSAKILML
eukprot:c6961_g1_i10.p1 GENE.c6961_g1_i10~~c6961_g1_i10.p1  ORF type:complete len:341 (+),score=74.37 c6961_g1_i10:1313-2335(+)